MLRHVFESHPCVVAGGDGLEGILVQQLHEGQLGISLVDIGSIRRQIDGELEDTALDHVAGLVAVHLGGSPIEDNFRIHAGAKSWRRGSELTSLCGRRMNGRQDRCGEERTGGAWYAVVVAGRPRPEQEVPLVSCMRSSAQLVRPASGCRLTGTQPLAPPGLCCLPNRGPIVRGLTRKLPGTPGAWVWRCRLLLRARRGPSDVRPGRVAAIVCV